MSRRVPPRSVRARVVVWGIGALALIGFSTARAQVSPEESARQLQPAEGLEATLWAAEPLVLNPTNMDIDSRGRVWITEGLNYRLSRGRNKPLTKQDGADRVKILDDTDGDGKADKVTVFADRIFPVPMGLAVEERYGKDGQYLGCKVYIGNSPNLLVLEDTDGDDKADKRYALLTGFGGVDSDHGVHGMVLGLDGKLYFTHGDGCCSVQPDDSERQENFNVTDRSGRHVHSANLAHTLRANRDGTQFEIICDRQRNNYETCLNAFGNIFTSDNDDDGNRGCRIIWAMDGGHYGYHTPGSPRHWGEDVPGNIPKLVGTGNGSPCGLMVYEGNLLPKEYRGGLLEAEAGTRQINFFPLTRHGASFRTMPKVLLASTDPWFRPVDVTAAPDGSIFIADWYDAGVGGHAFRDQTTGRIFRVAPKGSKPKRPKADFGTIAGLITALKSPAVATQDAARRSLIERGEQAVGALTHLFESGEPIDRARALWTLHAIKGDAVAEAALKDQDPQIREQAVRILGRDVSRVGEVEFTKPEAETPRAAARHLDTLLPHAHDPDPGVRRELILALRDLPTKQVGDALKTLTRAWDGQDRWYLEALGLALEKRESPYLAELFDGHLFGDLGLPASGKATGLALPPYFPVDRNEAFLATGDKDLPASPLSKTLGLAWRLHSPEVLPLLRQIMPQLASAELQQAADDVLTQVNDPAGAVVVADLALNTKDLVRKRQLLATLARRLAGAWNGARNNDKVADLIRTALGDLMLQLPGIEAAAATGDPGYEKLMMRLAQDARVPEEVRVAAVDAVGTLRGPGARDWLANLIGATRDQTGSNPVAEAAVRNLPKLGGARQQLEELMIQDDHPLALRREALRTLARGDGARRLIALAKAGQLPAELKTEATTALYTHPNHQIREEAADVLPPPKTAAGRALPPVFELIRRQGDAERGRAVFFRAGSNSCAACHRVQGRGQWVGPDLSTIGTKYGKDELLRSILNPSAAIGYNFQAYLVALKDGQVLTGLPVEQTADRFVLKTAEGRRINLQPDEIESKKPSEVSLMPEGLAETMTDQELVDLLAFLGTLKRPVSIVGQYQAFGPLSEPEVRKIGGDPGWLAKAGHAARRLRANAEGLVDLTGLLGDDSARAVLLHAPVVSPSEQEAELVIDTKANVKVWLNGHAVAPEPSRADATRSAAIRLPRGPSDLLIVVPGGPDATVVTTFVASQPLEFSASGSPKVSAH